jgi:hypothetical protein
MCAKNIMRPKTPAVKYEFVGVESEKSSDASKELRAVRKERWSDYVSKE